MQRSLARPRPHTGLLTGLLSCGVAAALVLSTLSVDGTRALYLLVALVAVLGLAACLALPKETLPTVAMVLVVLVPDRIADYSTSPVLNPATAVLSVWLVRRLLERNAPEQTVAPRTPDRLRRWSTVSAVLLTVGMVPLLAVAPVQRFSAGWVATFAVAVTAPLLVGDVEEEARRLRRALPWISSVVASYAVVQGLAARNLLYDPVYGALGLDEIQHWAVYRADASFGHPLTAGLFFATMLAFCIGRWMETQHVGFAGCALLNALGVVTTVSRGGYLSAAISVSVVLLVALAVQRRRRLRRLVLLAVFAGGGLLAVNADAFVERGLSSEGVRSVDARRAVPQIAWDTARASHWLGGGPANSSTVAEPYNFQHLPIENSYFQLLIDVGLWGLALFVLLLVLTAVGALRKRNLSGFGALLCFATALSGYAAIDSRRGLVVMLGLLVMVCLHRPDAPVPRPETGTGGRRRDGSRPVAHGASGAGAARALPVGTGSVASARAGRRG